MDVAIASIAQEVADRVVRKVPIDRPVVLRGRVLRGDDVVEVLEVQRGRQRQGGLDVVRMAVGHDVEAAGAQPIQEGSVVDPIEQVERSGGPVAVEDQVPDVAAGPRRAPDGRSRRRAPAPSRDFRGHDRHQRDDHEERRHEVQAAGHQRQSSRAGPDREHPRQADEADPADLEDDGPDAQGTEEPRDVAVHEERSRQGGHDEGRPSAVTDEVGADDQRDQRGEDDRDERPDEVARFQFAQVLPVQEQDRVRRQQQGMHGERPAAPGRAKPTSPRSRGSGGRAIVGHQRIIGRLTKIGATLEHA